MGSLQVSIILLLISTLTSSDTPASYLPMRPGLDTHALRTQVAHVLHSSPVSAKDPSGRPLNFQLWLSQQDRHLGREGGPGKHRQSNYHSRRYHNWTFARIIIPDIVAARALLAETKLRPITANGKKLKFVPDNSNKKIPFDVVKRLLSRPFGGKKAVLREQTAQTLRRGVNLHLFQLGTINREGDFASEHTVFDAANVPMEPAKFPARHHRGGGENDNGRPDKRARPNEYPAFRCTLNCEAGFKGMSVRILKREKIVTFRMNIRTIEQICWSPSSAPPPPPAFRPHPYPAPGNTAAGSKGHDEDINEDHLEPQDVIIRLSQPFVLEQFTRATSYAARLSELPSKAHISPYCFNTIYISGYNLVEALESMAKLFNSPYPWELHLRKSGWRRYTSTALKLVEDKMKTMPIPMAFQYQVS